MAPTSGGQYHWVSEFSPHGIQRPLSYLAGWLSTLSWVAGTAGGSFIMGSLITSILAAYRPSYKPQPYHTTLLTFAGALLQVLVNTVGASQLPRFQKVMMIPHGLGWVAIVVFLWVLAPHTDAEDVFTTFSSNGGWKDTGVSLMVGQITSVWFLICTYILSFMCRMKGLPLQYQIPRRILRKRSKTLRLPYHEPWSGASLSMARLVSLCCYRSCSVSQI